MNILGLHFGHDAAAVVVKDGKLVTAINSERILREKKTDKLTLDIINIALKEANITLDEVDAIALSDYIFRADSPLKLYTGKYQNVATVQRFFLNDIAEFDGVINDKHIKTFVIPHHLAHCASAYYTSNYDNAICYSMDSSFGDVKANSLVAFGSGNKLNAEYCPKNMVGVGYAVFTELLGIGPALFKAGSTMGLAPYGKIDKHVIDNISFYTKIFLETTSISNDNTLKNLFLDLCKRNNIDLTKKDKIDKISVMNIAATIQYIFEQTTLQVLNNIDKTKSDNLCLSGGSMLNCNANSLIKKESGFKNIHHFPACGDDGISVGSALYVAHHIYDEPRFYYSPQDISYLGVKQDYVEPDYSEVANVINKGGIVAWFMGRSEYGPRALGNRSLLADPRNQHSREILNFVVKDREWFRPFAPAVLEEDAEEWFEFDGPSPFMLYTSKVKKPDIVPAITHIDGSARQQTVSESANMPFYKLIKAFKDITGVPMVINTSLNGSGEPILETEEDAVNFFRKNKMVDLLVLNGKLIYRKDLV